MDATQPMGTAVGRIRACLGVWALAVMVHGQPGRAVANSSSVLPSPSDSASIILPTPTGRHPVGTFSAYWTDSARTDSVSGEVRPHLLSIQAWYPAERVASVAPAPYAPGVDSSGGDYGRLMARVRAHGLLRAPFAKASGRAPVVVFSTGRAMAAYDYTALAEDLASHGYVVVGVNSPRLSRFIGENGEPVAPRPPPSLQILQHFDSADVYFEEMVREVVADLRFVTHRLELAARSDPILRDHLDLGRLAMMGHSNGALAASRACAEDGRCRAFLGIEGTQTREIRKGGVRKPYALMISDQSLGFDAENVYRELGGLRTRASYTVVIVKGAGHNTFTDLLLIRPAIFDYPIAPRRGTNVARSAVRGFLDEQVLGRPEALRDAVTPYPEVELQASFP